MGISRGTYRSQLDDEQILSRRSGNVSTDGSGLPKKFDSKVVFGISSDGVAKVMDKSGFVGLLEPRSSTISNHVLRNRAFAVDGTNGDTVVESRNLLFHWGDEGRTSGGRCGIASRGNQSGQHLWTQRSSSCKKFI